MSIVEKLVANIRQQKCKRSANLLDTMTQMSSTHTSRNIGPDREETVLNRLTRRGVFTDAGKQKCLERAGGSTRVELAETDYRWSRRIVSINPCPFGGRVNWNLAAP